MGSADLFALAQLAWCSESSEGQADVPVPKPPSVLSLIAPRSETQFISPCPVGLKKQDFSCCFNHLIMLNKSELF